MKFNINVYINREKHEIARKRAKELNVKPSQVISYAIECLIASKRYFKISKQDRKFIEIGLNEYKPFEKEQNKTVTNVCLNLQCNKDVITNILQSHGIDLYTLCRAFYNAFLKCEPDLIPMRSSLNGFVLSSIGYDKVTNLPNKPFKIQLRLKNETYLKLHSIASKNHMSPTRMISSVFDSILEMEYSDSCIYNRQVLDAEILRYNGVVDMRVGSGSSFGSGRGFGFNMCDLEKSVKLLILLEKYGIPGKSELVYRAIRFIIMAHEGTILLDKIHVDDDSDYNETRMIRNEYRKEVQYATSR